MGFERANVGMLNGHAVGCCREAKRFVYGFVLQHRFWRHQD